MDQKGYVMSGMSFLMILPAIILVTVSIDMVHHGIECDSVVLESETALNTAKDLQANIPIIGKEVLKYEAEKVVKTGTPLSNSRKTVKDDLQMRVDQLSLGYYNKTGLKVECNITSVDNSPDPFQVEVNSTINVKKDRVIHKESISQNISLIDPQYPIPNPLPFTKCKNYGGVQIINNKIAFKSSLKEYLNARGVDSADFYENATTAYIIKKCPYDPYIMHGKNGSVSLKNCIENGYFHESSDGSCFLCRLEGKGTCPHYGMETFIVPHSSNNSTLNSAPSSIDHVIFNDTFSSAGTYPGNGLIYYSDGLNYFKIFLDNSHRQKYGLPVF